MLVLLKDTSIDAGALEYDRVEVAKWTIEQEADIESKFEDVCLLGG